MREKLVKRKIGRRFLTVVLSVCMLLTAQPDLWDGVMVQAAVGHQNHKTCVGSVCGDTSIAGDNTCNHGEETWTAWSYTTSNRKKIYKTNGTYYLSGDVTLDGSVDTISIPKGETLTLCLNGHTITKGVEGESLFTVQDGGTLNLCDCQGGGRLTGATKFANVGAVTAYGTFNMYGGAITGNEANTSSSTPGGVYIANYPTSAFNMYGGTISGNKGTKGGGVRCCSNFNLYAGTISDNEATEGGGGVSFDAYSGTIFNMYGGTISGNTAGRAGGGISTNGGEFNLYAGSVSDNKADSGGGIYTPSCVVNLRGGEIKGNAATNSFGGGIFAQNSANVNVYSGAVSGNTARLRGGGIYFDHGKITLDGRVNISGNTRDGGSADNVYLNGSVVTVGESFDTASAVGIHKSSTSTITCSYTEKIAENVSTDISAGFTSDTEDAHIEYTGSELKLMGNHRYPDTYSRDEDKHWKVCTIGNCGNIKDEAEHVYENGECVCGAMAPGAVTLHVNGGSGGTALSSYTHGTKVELPTDWVKTGYTFAGWYDNAGCTGTAVAEISAAAFGDKEYWAKWTAHTYTVTYNGLDGAAVSGNPASYTIESNTITLNNPKKDGYTFTGWSGTGLTGGKNTTVTIPKGSTGDRTYTANWEIADYMVTLHENGGNRGTSLPSYIYGTGAALPTDWTKTGYSFDGWYDNASCTGTAVTEISPTDTGNKEYWAKWTDNIAPVIGTLSYSYEPKNLWQWLIGKESLTITVPVTEEGSGAEEITYTVTPDGAVAKEETAEIKNGGAEIIISADFKGTISIVCTDKAGNTSEGVTVGADSGAAGIMIEDHAPKIIFEAQNAELVQSGEYKTAPDIAVTVTDNKDNAVSGGIASVNYKIGDGSEKTVDHDYTTDMVVNDSFTIPAGEIPAAGAVISVTATDNAGNSVTETYTVKVHIHSGTSIPAKAATCTETGLSEGSYCSGCGYVIKEQTVVAVLGHDFSGTYEQDEKHHWKKCSRCEEIQQKAEHIYDNDTDRDCNVCGYERTITPSGEVSKDVEKDEKAPDTTLFTSKEELAEIILAEEEKAQVENGTDIKFILNVKDAEDIVSSGDKAAVQEALSENTEVKGFAVGQYLDISLFKIVGENSSAISETARKLTIVIDVPDSLRSKDSAKPRTYAIIRVHNGVAEVLADLDDDADTITIATDRFSAYTIIYKQAGSGEDLQPPKTPAPTNAPAPTPDPTASPAPGKTPAPTNAPPAPTKAPPKTPDPTSSPASTMTPTLVPSPSPDSCDKSSPTPDSSEKPSPTPGTGEAAKPTAAPDVSAVPAQSPEPAESATPTQGPEPTQTAESTPSAAPTSSPVSTQNPRPTESVTPTQSPMPVQSAAPTQFPAMTPTLNPAPTGTPILTPIPAPIEKEEKQPDTDERKWELHSGLNAVQTGKKLQISWGRVSGADGYSVYVQYCGKDFSARSLNQVRSGKNTRITVKNVNGKKLDTTKNFKLYVVAWQWMDGKKCNLAKTLIVHIAGKDSAEFSNVKSIRLKKTSYTLEKGGTVTLRPKAVLYDRNKKQLSAAHTREFRYLSSNQKVAAVTAGGRVKAKGTGSCTIYVFAKNGCKRKTKIKVNG